MSLGEDNARFVLLKAFVDAATAELGKLRSGHLEALLERYREDRATSFKVVLPGTDDVVATVTLRGPKESMEFADQEAFIAWAERNHPDLIDTEVVPAQPERLIPATPERVEKSVNGKALTAWMKHLTTEDGEVIDTTTGLVVDGMVHKPAGKPNQFAVLYENGGQDKLASAYRAGKLNDLVAGTALPALTPPPMVERRLEVVRVDDADVSAPKSQADDADDFDAGDFGDDLFGAQPGGW
jgi:hypothetical protein